MEQQTVTVEMTAEEAAAFQERKAKQLEKDRKKTNRDAYKEIVGKQIEESIPLLCDLSKKIAETKQAVYDNFNAAIDMKREAFGAKIDKYSSHTFTNSDNNARIILGYNLIDNYLDSVNAGVAVVKEVIQSLATDENSQILVDTILKLLSKDDKGNLKASRVLSLQKLADKINNERLSEGVRIIRDAYNPTVSKQYIRAEKKNEKGEWVAIPLSTTEA